MKKESEKNFINAFIRIYKKTLENKNYKFEKASHARYNLKEAKYDLDFVNSTSDLDSLLEAFHFENGESDINVTFYGTVKGHEFYLKISRDYNDSMFILVNNSLDYTVSGDPSFDNNLIVYLNNKIEKSEEQLYKELVVAIREFISKQLEMVNSQISWLTKL